MPDRLQDAAHQRDLAERAVEPARGVDQAEVALLQILGAELHDAAAALEEAVPLEGVVLLGHAPLLGAGAELGLGALAAAGDEAVAARVAGPLGRGGHVLVDDPHGVRVEAQVRLGQVLVVVVLDQAQAHHVALGLEEDHHAELLAEAGERRGQLAGRGRHGLRVDREPELHVELAGELGERGGGLVAGLGEVEVIDHHHVGLEVRDVAGEGHRLEDAGHAGAAAAERDRRGRGLGHQREDEPVALDVELDRLGGLQLRGGHEIVEDLVVVGADVIDGVLVRDVEHAPIAHQIVERDLHEQRGLAHAVSRGDHAHVAAAEPAVHRLLEDPHRAPLIDFFTVHGSMLLTSPSWPARRGTS